MTVRRSARVQALGASVSVPQAIAVNPISSKRKPVIEATTAQPMNDSTDNANKTKAETHGNEAYQTPVTPNKRRKAAPITPKLPPVTPTPSAISQMLSKTPLSYSTGDIDGLMPPKIRPAGPHRTNAPLQVSGESDIPPGLTEPEVSPSKGSNRSNGVPNPTITATTTTKTLLEQAIAHLVSVDPALQRVISQHHCRVFDPEGLAEVIDPFRSLASGIMAQQVSGAAATSIKNKFIGLFPASTADAEDVQHAGPPHFPPPALVVRTPLPTLRSAGLSQRKAEYIQGLAEKFVAGELSARMLAETSDEEVMEKLVAVRGLGRWSVEMFCCFGLKRMDVFSTGDLGVQRGMAAYVGRDVAKLKAKGGGKWKYMSEKDMLDISAKFTPYRSLFMWLMWRIEDVNVDAVQNA